MVVKVNAIDTSYFVKNAVYDKKIEDILKKIHSHDKYITTNECNKLTKENFPERLKQAKLATKDDIADSVNSADWDEKPININ